MSKTISSAVIGETPYRPIAVSVVERAYTCPAVDAHHWSGGDDIRRAEIASGKATYWTVVVKETGRSACGGKRWASSAGAEAWIEHQQELDAELAAL